MSRDFRRDHSFRIPRPDLSQKFETPNACSSCHSDKSMEWVLKNYKKMFKEPKEHFSEVLVAANNKDPLSIEKLKLLIKKFKQNYRCASYR